MRSDNKCQHIQDRIKIGEYCAKYRRKIDKTQHDVAKETGYTEQNISAFERGITDSITIFMWYIKNGLFDNGGNAWQI